MPKLPTVAGELAAAIRRGKGDGRLGAEHRLDVTRARLLVEMLTDPATPRTAVAALDRRLDVVLMRLGLVAPAAGATDLESWLAGVLQDVKLEPDPDPDPDPDDDPGPETLPEFMAAIDRDVASGRFDDDPDFDPDPGADPAPEG